MNELNLLGAAIQSRDTFTTLKYLGFGKDISETSKAIWKEIGEYYHVDQDARTCDKDLLKERLFSKHTSDIHRKQLSQTLGNIREVSVPNVVSLYKDYKKNLFEEQLAVSVQSGVREKIPDIIARWREIEDIGEETYGTLLHKGIEFDSQELSKFTPFKLSPQSLNKWIDGGMEKEEQAVVFARPNIGKTAFAFTLSCGFIKQGLKVLFLTNEDPPRKVKIRFTQAFLKATKQRVLENPEGASRAVMDRGGDKFFFKEMDGGGTLDEIEKHIIECEPDVLIVDMMRHIQVKGNSKHEKLEEICRRCRDMAKKYQFISFLFTQANDSAEGKEFLGKGDVDESNTGVPGACDIMIGIGASETQMGTDKRRITFCKNKRGLENSSCEITLDRPHSRFV